MFLSSVIQILVMNQNLQICGLIVQVRKRSFNCQSTVCLSYSTLLFLNCLCNHVIVSSAFSVLTTGSCSVLSSSAFPYKTRTTIILQVYQKPTHLKISRTKHVILGTFASNHDSSYLHREREKEPHGYLQAI